MLSLDNASEQNDNGNVNFVVQSLSPWNGLSRRALCLFCTDQTEVDIPVTIWIFGCKAWSKLEKGTSSPIAICLFVLKSNNL